MEQENQGGELKKLHFCLRFHDADGEEISIRFLKDFANSSITAIDLDDLYEYCRNGILENWLESQGNKEKADNIKEIKGTKDEKDLSGLMKALLQTLEINFDEKDLKCWDDSRRMAEKTKEIRGKIAKSQKQCSETISNAISNAISDYDNKLLDIIDSGNDFPLVKKKVRDLLKSYPEFFQMDLFRFFNLMAHQCPLAIFTVLMENHIETLLSLRIEKGSFCSFSADMTDNVNRYLAVEYGYWGGFRIRLDGEDWTDELLKEGIIESVDFSDKMDGGWYECVEEGRRIRILYCSKNISIRSCGDEPREIEGANWNPGFQLFDGLEVWVDSPYFYVNKSYHRRRSGPILLYMEVE